MPRKYTIGFLTEHQAKVLVLKNKGYSCRQIASKLGVSHQNIALTLKKVLKNIRRARETIIFYELVSSPIKIIVRPGVKLVEIPKIVIEEADKKNIRVKADFTLIYKLIRFKARKCIDDKEVVKPILVVVDSNGFVNIYPYEDIALLNEYVEKINSYL